MACEHAGTIEVLGSCMVEVSDEGAMVLFELQKCDECGHEWLAPYLAMPDIDPIPEGFKVEKGTAEDGSPEIKVTPTDEYVRKTLGVGKHTRITVL